MDMQTATAVAPERATKSNGAAGAAVAKATKSNGKTAPRANTTDARRIGQQEAFKVRATVKEKTMKIGDRRLARMFFDKWRGMHHSLHYLTDFARTQLKGRVVRAANRGVNLYLQEKLDEARNMLQTATDLADKHGIDIGTHGDLTEGKVEITCPAESDVMEMVRLLDDYVLVVDSLWMERVLDDKRRDAAHAEVCDVVLTLSRLLTRLRRKMIDYRHAKLNPKLTKGDTEYERELENIVLDITGIDLRRMREAEEGKKKGNGADKANGAEKAKKGNGVDEAAAAQLAALAAAAKAPAEAAVALQ